MENKVLLVSCVVGLLGLLSAATGFGAEATRIKGSQVQFVTLTQCAYPRSPALPLGLTAALALMIAQIIINVSTGCFCCRRSPRIPDSNRKVAPIYFGLSWITFVFAFLMFLAGAALNDQHGELKMRFGNYCCYVVKPGVFAAAALLSLSSVTFGIICYHSLTAGKKGSNPSGDSSFPNQGDIAMGQVQIPPHSSREPV